MINNEKMNKIQETQRKIQKQNSKSGFAVVVATFFDQFLDDFRDFVFGMLFSCRNQQPILGSYNSPMKSDNFYGTCNKNTHMTGDNQRR